jgi:serine/threonine-protein kinase
MIEVRWQEGAVARSRSLEMGVLRLGRDPQQCDLCLDDPHVSRFHALIARSPESPSYVLRRKSATNGVFLEGQAVAEVEVDVPLPLPCRVQLGKTLLWITAITTPGVRHVQCPNAACRKLHPYDRVADVCAFCGTSLAGGRTVVDP